MSRTIILAVELTVDDDANHLDMADWLMTMLCDSDDVVANDAIESIDGVEPRRT